MATQMTPAEFAQAQAERDPQPVYPPDLAAAYELFLDHPTKDTRTLFMRKLTM